MNNPLNGKIALVTGGGRGIGRSISLRLAKEGAKVAVLSLHEDNAKAVAREIAEMGEEAFAFEADVSDKRAVNDCVSNIISSWGQIDILVNNAGIGIFNPLLEVTEEELDTQFEVNVKGTIFTLQATVENMIKTGQGGRIVNLSSQSGRRGDANCLSYSMSKAAVISVTQSAALALAKHKINVNAVAPGMVDTEFWDAVDQRFATLFNMPVGEPKRLSAAAVPWGRMAHPDEVASVVAFLVGPDAAYITGQTYNVDGGNILS